MFGPACNGVLIRMQQEPLTERELKRLQKIDRKLSRGRLRFGLLGLLIGVIGGLSWVVMMWLAAPGFGTNMRISPPAGRTWTVIGAPGWLYFAALSRSAQSTCSNRSGSATTS